LSSIPCPPPRGKTGEYTQIHGKNYLRCLRGRRATELVHAHFPKSWHRPENGVKPRPHRRGRPLCAAGARIVFCRDRSSVVLTQNMGGHW